VEVLELALTSFLERREQRVEGVLVVEASAVHKEGWGAVDSAVQSRLEVLTDPPCVDTLSQVVLEGRQIETQAQGKSMKAVPRSTTTA
jgi:hypothetical protein